MHDPGHGVIPPGRGLAAWWQFGSMRVFPLQRGRDRVWVRTCPPSEPVAAGSTGTAFTERVTQCTGCVTVHSSARKCNNGQAILGPFHKPISQEQIARQNGGPVCSVARGWILTQHKPETRAIQGSFSTGVRLTRKQTTGVGVAFLLTERSYCRAFCFPSPWPWSLSPVGVLLCKRDSGLLTQQGRLTFLASSCQ